MKLAYVCGVAALSSALLGHAQTAQESTLHLAQYGLIKKYCDSRPERVDFLDDDHLVIIAPVAETCDKNSSGKPTETRITVIDLQGHQVASVRQPQVAGADVGPTGYVALCTGDRVEFLASDLRLAFSVSDPRKNGGCSIGGRSASRKSMLVRGPSKSQFRLYRGASPDPVAEMIAPKGGTVRDITDDGFLLCMEEDHSCAVTAPGGVALSFPVPQLGGAEGYYIAGLVTPGRLLVANYAGTDMHAITPAGTDVPMGDVCKLKPPFIDFNGIQMSAVEPRRILYTVEGCPLGDFDDCYGVIFHRFVVFDSENGRLLFRHSYRSEANLRISPNGKVVIEQYHDQVNLFRLP